MNKELLHTNILEAIKEKVPNKATLANQLVDILCIEKEAVYRRLRGDVAFTLTEIAHICSELGISLDNIISSSVSKKSKPFQLNVIDFSNPTESDYTMMERYVDALRNGIDDPYSELVDSTNTLPLAFYYGYKYLERFQLFKSLYQSGKTNTVKSFNEVQYPKRVEQLQREEALLTRQIKNSYYIFDPLIFQYLINDIQYYRSINLINEEDAKHLKTDLTRLINQLELLAISGCDKDTGNKVYLYIGSVNFDVSVWYVEFSNYHISMIKAFVLNNFVSLDDDSLVILKQRIGALLRSSTMISVSGEKQRIAFFEKQKQLISTL